MTTKVCSLTTGTHFPHHWDCIYTDQGHPGCTCDDSNNYCSAYQCTVTNRSRRVPDGSGVVRNEIKNGKVFMANYDLSGEPPKIIPLN